MIKSIYEAHFDGKNVLVRVDFNVPMDANRNITDDTRVLETLPTIDKIIDDGGLPILCSHLGRPKGTRDEKYSLAPVAKLLEDKYGYKVFFANDCIGETAKKAIADAELGSIVLLENLRFYKGETDNDPEFSKALASLGDIYVNDAFGAAHRAHASVVGAAELFSERFAGKLMKAELLSLSKATSNPAKPYTVIIGGAKISGKIDVIRNLMNICDNILIGGGMMFTFFKAQGLEIGKSILEEDKIDLAKELLELAQHSKVNLVLPIDTVTADSFSNDAATSIVKVNSIKSDKLGMDIGPETCKLFADIISQAKTIVWNGPMGVFEMENFANGTFQIAQAIAQATSRGAFSVIGGGDSVSAIKKTKLDREVSHISTGGGASLEYLEGKELPGVKALE
ncbi:MAG: phosphoglycerate kinase [Candidatus Kapabacteria bacterium]|nr:phosphoglycerate kinase [Candidatus Kapabacteria bacterium]